MKKIALFTLLFSLSLAALTLPQQAFAQSQPIDKVVAVVNNDVITQQELDKRFQYIIRQNKFNLPKDQQRLVYRNTLNELINEQVQRQFAERMGIKVSNDEISMAIAELERNNNLSKGGFFNLASGIEDTAKAKIEADLIWQKIIQKQIQPRVVISPNEVDRMIENLTASAQTQEKEVKHIFIPGNGNDEEELKQIFDIYNQVQDDNNAFDALAKTYSTTDNGYLGWFAEGELAPTLEAAIKTLDIGDMSKPVQSSMGWHIVKVLNTRETKAFETEPFNEYKFYVLSMDTPSKEQREALKEAAENFRTLGDMEEFILKNELKMDLSESGEKTWMREDDFPTWLMAERIEQGRFTDLIETKNGVMLYYTEEVREQLPEQLRMYRQRMLDRLTANRTNLTARRFMRDLRRAAYIDIRI